jgi:hypothetical protein
MRIVYRPEVFPFWLRGKVRLRQCGSGLGENVIQASLFLDGAQMPNRSSLAEEELLQIHPTPKDKEVGF